MKIEGFWKLESYTKIKSTVTSELKVYNGKMMLTTDSISVVIRHENGIIAYIGNYIINSTNSLLMHNVCAHSEDFELQKQVREFKVLTNKIIMNRQMPDGSFHEVHWIRDA